MKIFLLLFLALLSNFTFALTKKEFIDIGANCINDEAVICTSQHAVYPNKLAFIFNENQKIENLLVHLHGHSFGLLPTGEDFDSTPIKMIKSFEFNKYISQLENTLMVIPFTTKKCFDYDNYLQYGNNFDNLINHILEYITNTPKVHLSAHSGGGRTIARTINKMSTVISSISLFDAIYSSKRTSQYTKWFALSEKKINLIAVAPKDVNRNYNNFKGATPFNESIKVFNSNKSGSSFKEDSNFYIFKKKSDNRQMSLYYIPQKEKYEHWYIVRRSFGKILQSFKE